MDIKILLKKGVPVYLNCIGFSMYPLIKENDKVLIKKTCKYCKGEVIAYCLKEKIFVHRITSFLKKSGKIFYEVRGDSQINSHLVNENQILGKVEMIYTKNKIIYLKKDITKSHYIILLKYLNLISFINNFYLKFIKIIFIKNSQIKYLQFIKNNIKYLQLGLTKKFLRTIYETKT